MGRATIDKHIDAGQYAVEYVFNTELIEFESNRLKLRRSDVDPDLLLKAQTDYNTKTAARRDAGDALKVLLQQLRGEVSPEVITQLNAAVTALTTADTALGQVSNQRANAGSALNASVSAFPSSPPPEVSAAYNAAFAALSTATFDLTDEAHELASCRTATTAASNAAGGSTPDPDTVRDRIQTARDTFAALLAASATVVTSLGIAATRTQTAAESLPGSGWTTAATHADHAVFALNNSDEDAGTLGAISLHSQVVASYSTASTALKTAADLMTPGKAETKEEVKKAVKTLHDASTAEGVARLALDQLNLELSQLDNRIAELDAIEKTRKVNLWCADYTLNIEELKDVGTIEVPGEYGQKGEAIIRPGFREAGLPWNRARDGYVTPLQALTAAGYFYNRAMLPGWQVFRPTYRFARVKAHNDDGTLKIELLTDAVNGKSSQQDIDITPKSLPANDYTEPDPVDYSKVPVEYMDCHAAAFFVDDEVIVAYEGQKAEKPKVIGFRKEPRSCNGISFFTEAGDRLQITTATDETAEDTWTRTPKEEPIFGDTYWVGTRRALSWFGRKRRHWTRTQEDLNILEPDASISWVLQDGKKIATAPGSGLGATPGAVLGAALVKDFLVIVCTEEPEGRDAAYYKRLGADAPETGDPENPWIELDSYLTGPDAPGYPFAPYPSNDTWIFSTSGLKAACVKKTARGDAVYALITLQLTLSEEGELSGEFTVTNGVAPVETSVVEDHTTCPAYPARPSDCVVDVVSDITRRYSPVAVDFIKDGENEIQVLFEYVDTFHTQSTGEYGPAFEECHVGGNGFAEFASGGSTHTETRRLVCPALAFDLTISDIHSTSSFSGTSYEVPADNDLGCVPYITDDRTATSTQTGFAIEHLNVTGGADKVIVIGRQLDLVDTVTTSMLGGAFGPDVPGYPGHNTSVDTLTGTQTLHIRVGPNTMAYAPPVSIDNTVPDVFSYDEEAIKLRDLFVHAEPYDLAWIACDRKGHLTYSSPLFEVLIGVPTLPPDTADGDPAQFVETGLG